MGTVLTHHCEVVTWRATINGDGNSMCCLAGHKSHTGMLCQGFTYGILKKKVYDLSYSFHKNSIKIVCTVFEILKSLQRRLIHFEPTKTNYEHFSVVFYLTLYVIFMS